MNVHVRKSIKVKLMNVLSKKVNECGRMIKMTWIFKVMVNDCQMQVEILFWNVQSIRRESGWRT